MVANMQVVVVGYPVKCLEFCDSLIRMLDPLSYLREHDDRQSIACWLLNFRSPKKHVVKQLEVNRLTELTALVNELEE